MDTANPLTPASAVPGAPAGVTIPGGKRWRGFNLTSMFLRPGDHRFADMFPWEPAGFRETDFQWIAEWGFNCVRLPLCWHIWSTPKNATTIDELQIVKIDRALDYGARHGLHVMLNLHAAPGYCVHDRNDEGFDLWRDRAALDAFVFQWRFFAERYRGLAPQLLSFNLVNEPNGARDDHERVMRTTIASIRAIDAARPIILDGVEGGGKTMPELADLGIIQSCRGYSPIEVSHHRAWWVPAQDIPLPGWPVWVPQWNQIVNKQSLWNAFNDHGWIQLARSGAPVVCGEFGAYNLAPHNVVLGWMRDLLAVLRQENIGFLLWNFRGSFGVLDSARADVDYEDWYGHKLDRTM
ncbi:MAG: cellulase family glycosylhydrolase, partial [Phycisphaerae bacterium]